jgi:predicted class III extradiol MEMO1 family dioxygenase
MTARVASHAGTWYSAAPKELSAELDVWLKEVGTNVKELDVGTGESAKEGLRWDTLPIPGARVIIAP